MFRRLQDARQQVGEVFAGPIEMVETYMGGKEGNKHASKKLRAGRGTVGKTPVMGAKDRETKQVKAQVPERTNRETLRNFLSGVASPDERPYIYRDEASVFDGLGISSVRLSSIRRASMCVVRPIRTALKPSGRC